MTADRIEKKTFLRAPLGRVWRALTDHEEFGAWFGMKLDGPFVPGQVLRGTIVPTTVDADVAAAQKQYTGMPVTLWIEELVPERRFSFRWHPFAIERDVDYSGEPTTLIVFTLEAVADGVSLTLTESGFDRIPLARRARAFSANEGGWGMVLKLIDGYLARAA